MLNYVLPLVIYREHLQNFIGPTRLCFGFNFYIDVNRFIIAGKVQRLHQLVEHDIQLVNCACTCSCTCIFIFPTREATS